MFTTCTHVFDYLHSLGLFHMDLTLDRMHTALSRLDLTHPPFAVAHIVGTNGKGSTSTFLAALSTAHQRRTGLFTSPHFVSPRERIRCNGVMLPEERWPRLATAVHKAEPHLTYFEFLTVLAILAFAEADVELAVMEAGLGGRWDATTALPADLLCLTPISMDHEQVLGTTLTAIATDKAGAIRHGMPVLHAAQAPEALIVLQDRARELDASLQSADLMLTAEDGYTPLGLHGPHQHENARLALAAWRTMARMHHWAIDAQAEKHALATAFLPGRLQHLTLPCASGSMSVLLDGAHNPHGMEALCAALQQENIRPRAVIFSCLADKDKEHMLPCLRQLNAPLFIPTIADNSRAAAGDALAIDIGAGARAVPRLADALNAAAQSEARDHTTEPVVICGSLYLLGEFFTLYPQFLEPPR